MPQAYIEQIAREHHSDEGLVVLKQTSVMGASTSAVRHGGNAPCPVTRTTEQEGRDDVCY